MKKFRKYNNRINMFEVRNNHQNKLLFGDKNYSHYELIKWQKNNKYNKEQEYIDNGYVVSFGGEFLIKDNLNVDRNIFKSEESCYVIGFFRPNYSEPDALWIDIIADRFSDLTVEELITVHSLIKEATIEIVKQTEKITK